ncbi:MAG TPA: DUF1493 family protein [Bryobacteraceae bacterium]|nr:DUF1493 family protein [Bryobacteraceae bacterium]
MAQAEGPSFDEFARFVREWAGIPKRKAISAGTEFEADLGITGDDGDDLLQATEKRFRVQLHDDANGYRKTFNLEFNEFLFGPEVPSFTPLITIFDHHEPHVRRFTVGELYRAVCQAISSR